MLFLVEADGSVGRGDAFIAGGLPKDRTVLVVNKVDRVGRDRIAEQLIAASAFGFDEYFPISARNGEGVDALRSHVLDRLPVGPQYYPDDMVTDVPEAFSEQRPRFMDHWRVTKHCLYARSGQDPTELSPGGLGLG